MGALAGVAAAPDGGAACVDTAIVGATNATPPASHILFSQASSPEIFFPPDGLAQSVCRPHALSTAESNVVSKFLIAVPIFHGNPPAHASASDETRCGQKYSPLSARLCGFRGNYSFNSNEVRIVTYAQRRENESYRRRSHRANLPANPLYSWVLVLMIEAIRH